MFCTDRGIFVFFLHSAGKRRNSGSAKASAKGRKTNLSDSLCRAKPDCKFALFFKKFRGNGSFSDGLGGKKSQ